MFAGFCLFGLLKQGTLVDHDFSYFPFLFAVLLGNIFALDKPNKSESQQTRGCLQGT